MLDNNADLAINVPCSVNPFWSNRTEKMSLAEARAFLHEESLQRKYFRDGKRVEFVHFVKEETGKRMPWNMPRDPMRFYRQREEWVSWEHFLKPVADDVNEKDNELNTQSSRA
jgi:hypothetical protein